MKLRRITTLFCALALLLTLAACGGSSGKTDFVLQEETYHVEKWERRPDYDTDSTSGYALCILQKSDEFPIQFPASGLTGNSAAQPTSLVDVTLEVDGTAVKSKNIVAQKTSDTEGYLGRISFEFALPKDADLPTSGTFTYSGSGQDGDSVTLDLSKLTAPE